MLPDPAPFPDPRDAEFYQRYLKTCAMLGVEQVTRERADGLMQEWTEVLSGRPDPTTH